jgi:hypothetical protein
MTTPTDDEIVKYVLAQDWGYAGTAVRQALRIAREGLPVPVKDEARTIWKAALARYEEGGSSLEDCHCRATATIRTFLATRDAERDEEVAELVDHAKVAVNQFRYYARSHRTKGTPDGDSKAETNDYHADRLAAALAKLERKP